MTPTASASAADPASAAVPGVVGRDAELAATRAFLNSVADGPQALLIEGEAGIGKTALWRAATAQARAAMGLG